MSEVSDRLRARCQQARGQGKRTQWFRLEDVEYLLEEHGRFEEDNLDLIARVDEGQERLDV